MLAWGEPPTKPPISSPPLQVWRCPSRRSRLTGGHRSSATLLPQGEVRWVCLLEASFHQAVLRRRPRFPPKVGVRSEGPPEASLRYPSRRPCPRPRLPPPDYARRAALPEAWESRGPRRWPPIPQPQESQTERLPPPARDSGPIGLRFHRKATPGCKRDIAPIEWPDCRYGPCKTDKWTSQFSVTGGLRNASQLPRRLSAKSPPQACSFRQQLLI